ncbi:MAG: hypothetical protein NT040_07840 [Bacteroidetes bacterium]|nr:hypothetical protein [Bacteroidota bacterium]
MKENDPIEHKFRQSFSNFEEEPPSGVWENLQKELHPPLQPGNIWIRTAAFFHLTGKSVVYSIALGGAALGFFVSVAYLALRDRHTIRGHAYSGNVRLHNGSAELFEVADNTIPWDSATHYRSAIIDNYGHFRFAKIRPGKYMLRIAPDRNSEPAKNFLPAWYEQCEDADSCKLIIISNQDISLEVHLIPKIK